MKNSFLYLFMAFVLSLLCFPQISLSGQDLIAPSNAFTYNDTSFYKIDEIYNGDGTFNANFSILLQQTSGIANITSADLGALNTKVTSANITAKDMQGFATGGKSAGQDIVVRLGGLDWTPTYLSKTKSGDLILTMWLSNNEQDAFQTRTDNAAEGDFYGFVKSTTTNKYGLYSDWSADWTATTPNQGIAAFYPSNMYGTSYIRSVTLNNGGQYATSNTALAADPGQNSTSIFAPFTMSSNPLSSFIVTPSEVSWQEKQSATATNGAFGSNDYPNDEWNPDSAQGKYYSDAYNYVEHDGYDTWKNDKLWLPSMAETGYSTSKPGLWNPSSAQRDNYNGASTSFTARIGTSENKISATTAYTYSWLRSGTSNGAFRAYYLSPSGSDYSLHNVNYAQAVRPALHLNLTDAAKVAKLPFTGLVSSDPSDPDIYQEPGENEGEIIFHIKSAQGLVKMSDYSQNDGVWDENWTFLLDNDVDLTTTTEFQHIGAANYDGSDEEIYNPSFRGTFNGMGHTITGPLQFFSVYNADISNFTLKNSDVLFIGYTLGYVNVSNIFVDNYLNASYGFIEYAGESLIDEPIYTNLNIYNITMTSSLDRVGNFIGIVYSNTKVFASSSMLLVNFGNGFIRTFRQTKNSSITLANIFVQNYRKSIIKNDISGDIIISGCEFHTSTTDERLSSYDPSEEATLYIYDTLFEGPGFSLFGNGNNKFGSGGNSCNRGSFSGYICDGDQTTEYGSPIQSNWFTDANGKPHLRHFYWAGQVI